MGSTARILVIDDDQNIRDSLSAILQDRGYSVDLAENGYQAIQKSERTNYNLALIDIKLPDMEGIVLLSKLKDGVPKTRKIIVTGFPSMDNAINALNKKADAYITKPVDINQLLETIQEQLKSQNDEKAFSEQKVADFIETRVKEIENIQKE